MPVNNPTWSYGISKLFTSRGAIPDPDDAWSYGTNKLFHDATVLLTAAKTFRSKKSSYNFSANGQTYYLKAQNETYTIIAKAV